MDSEHIFSADLHYHQAKALFVALVAEHEPIADRLAPYAAPALQFGGKSSDFSDISHRSEHQRWLDTRTPDGPAAQRRIERLTTPDTDETAVAKLEKAEDEQRRQLESGGRHYRSLEPSVDLRFRSWDLATVPFPMPVADTRLSPQGPAFRRARDRADALKIESRRQSATRHETKQYYDDGKLAALYATKRLERARAYYVDHVANDALPAALVSRAVDDDDDPVKLRKRAKQERRRAALLAKAQRKRARQNVHGVSRTRLSLAERLRRLRRFISRFARRKHDTPLSAPQRRQSTAPPLPDDDGRPRTADSDEPTRADSSEKGEAGDTTRLPVDPLQPKVERKPWARRLPRLHLNPRGKTLNRQLVQQAAAKIDTDVVVVIKQQESPSKASTRSSFSWLKLPSLLRVGRRRRLSRVAVESHLSLEERRELARRRTVVARIGRLVQFVRRGVSAARRRARRRVAASWRAAQTPFVRLARASLEAGRAVVENVILTYAEFVVFTTRCSQFFAIRWFQEARYRYDDLVSAVMDGRAEELSLMFMDKWAGLHTERTQTPDGKTMLLVAMQKALDVDDRLRRALAKEGRSAKAVLADLHKRRHSLTRRDRVARLFNDVVLYDEESPEDMFLQAQAQTRVLECLLRNGADVNTRQDPRKHDGSGWGLLHHAAVYDNVERLSWATDRGAIVDVASESGQTPLMVAARSKAPNAVQHFLEYRANVFRTDSQGWTALHYAAAAGADQCAALLLRAGADQTVRTTTDLFQTAADVAQGAGHTDTAWLITLYAEPQLALADIFRVLGGDDDDDHVQEPRRARRRSSLLRRSFAEEH